MPVDHLIGFSDLMPDKLEMELIKRGNIPLTPLGLEKMRPDLGYAGAKARMLFQPDRSKAFNPKSSGFSRLKSPTTKFHLLAQCKTGVRYPAARGADTLAP